MRTAGRMPEAIALYRQLAQQYRNDGQLQMEYGDVLLTADDDKTLTTALEQWQTILERLPPTSEDTLKARYNIALRTTTESPCLWNVAIGSRYAAQRLKLLKITADLERTPWKASSSSYCRSASSNCQPRKSPLQRIGLSVIDRTFHLAVCEGVFSDLTWPR